MSYRIILSPKAEDQLAALESPLQNAVEAQLRRLAENPTGLSRRSVTPPWPPDCQLYEFGHELDRRRHHFAVLFRYGVDEETLFVLGIGHVRYRDDES